MPDPNTKKRVHLPFIGKGASPFDSPLDQPSSAPSASPTPSPTLTSAPTATPRPTRTSAPTPTPRPTRTSSPTPTPRSTRTSAPTATPSPTRTGAPTATPQPGSTATPTSGAPAIYIDLHRCIGCNACSLACKQENNVELGELWNEVYGSESGAFPTAGVRVLPMLCHHCGNAPCKAKCDSLGFHAIVQRSDGIVYIDPAQCTGCQQCLATCRYKAISFNAKTNKAEKCHFCMHRIDAGLEPACVITCLAITREFGDYATLRAKHPNAKSMGGKVRILYDNMGGEPEHDGSTAGFPNPVECHH